ncbi:MAG: ferric reductase-like transmembrane domain-containing protein [Actinomycetia bacterium]|nr:ferric reductase-like transmembrane domain-containing protein [Actinomycetes bacterium]
MIAASGWWYLSRSTGLIAGILLVAAFTWGVLLSTQLVKPVKRAAWLLDLHRWLGGLTVVFVVLHLVGLVADSFVEFDLASIFVPFASEWKPAAVTWGVVGLYLLVAIQISSWQPVRSRLSRRLWRAIHLLSFPLLWVVAMHSGAAGTDVSNRLYVVSLVLLIAISVFIVLYRLLAGTGRKRRNEARTTAHNEPRDRSDSSR